MNLALYTFGIFIKPSEHADNDGFHRRNDPVLAEVDTTPGLIARSGYDDEPGPECWGEQVYPRFYQERGDGWSPSTLSVWRDLESLMAFTYSGLHVEALRHGRQWFEKPQWPPLVCWWVKESHTPTWAEAIVRHEHLHDHGASPYAFNFKTPFDDDGGKMEIDRQRVKSIINHPAAG